MPDDSRYAAMQALLRFQAVAAKDLPTQSAAQMSAALELFPLWCVQREFGSHWTPDEQALWARASQALIDASLAQPTVALREPVGMAGPIMQDIAALLRDVGVAEDESSELDQAIRWWDAARRSGLPVPADFGECWRALEWAGLQRHLMLLGQYCRQKHEAGAKNEASEAAIATLLAGASKVAMRYGPLKPLLRLLQPLQAAPLGVGYTF